MKISIVLLLFVYITIFLQMTPIDATLTEQIQKKLKEGNSKKPKHGFLTKADQKAGKISKTDIIDTGILNTGSTKKQEINATNESIGDISLEIDQIETLKNKENDINLEELPSFFDSLEDISEILSSENGNQVEVDDNDNEENDNEDEVNDKKDGVYENQDENTEIVPISSDTNQNKNDKSGLILAIELQIFKDVVHIILQFVGLKDTYLELQLTNQKLDEIIKTKGELAFNLYEQQIKYRFLEQQNFEKSLPPLPYLNQEASSTSILKFLKLTKHKQNETQNFFLNEPSYEEELVTYHHDVKKNYITYHKNGHDKPVEKVNIPTILSFIDFTFENQRLESVYRSTSDLNLVAITEDTVSFLTNLYEQRTKITIEFDEKRNQWFVSEIGTFYKYINDPFYLYIAHTFQIGSVETSDLEKNIKVMNIMPDKTLLVEPMDGNIVDPNQIAQELGFLRIKNIKFKIINQE